MLREDMGSGPRPQASGRCTDDEFSKIDTVVRRVQQLPQNAAFANELKSREGRKVPTLLDDNEVLRNLAYIVAYAHARSARVDKMLATDVYEKAWMQFDVASVAKLNPCDVIEAHWHKINPIMNGAKAYFLVMAARAMQRLDREKSGRAFAALLNDCGVPRSIHVDTDVDQFWRSFQSLRKQMKAVGMPYLGSITSLSHLLLHLGYDCVKPDVIVMNVAAKIGLLEGKDSDAAKVKVAQTLQHYALRKGLRPSVVDMYFLVDGDQSGARSWSN